VLSATSYLSAQTGCTPDIGQFDDAWCCIREAISASDATKERWFEAETNRIAGEITLKSPEPVRGKRKSISSALLQSPRLQQAKSPGLRTAMSLAGLWRDQGKVREARELLAPVYGWFTEGFGTRDLKEAKALLQELASEVSNREWSAAQIFRPLHTYEYAEALLLRIALLFRLDEPIPDFLIDRTGLVDFRGAIEARDAAPRQQAGFAQRRLAEEDGDLTTVHQIGVGRSSAALPQCEVLVVEHHRAAARGNLSISIRQHCADQAHMRRIGIVKVLMQNFRNDRQCILPVKMAIMIDNA
jgi:hypothetical protein